MPERPRTILPKKLPELSPEDAVERGRISYGELSPMAELGRHALGVLEAELEHGVRLEDVRDAISSKAEQLSFGPGIETMEDIAEVASMVNDYNGSPSTQGRIEGLRRGAFVDLRNLFRLGLLPIHPLPAEVITKNVAVAPMRVALAGAGLPKNEDGRRDNHLGITLKHEDGTIALHEMIHEALEDHSDGLGVSSESLREAAVEYIAFAGRKALSREAYDKGKLDEETRRQFAQRTFKELASVDLEGASYREDIRLLLEFCDHDFDKLTSVFEALFDKDKVAALDGFEGTLGLQSEESTVKQIGEIADGVGEKAQRLQRELFGKLGLSAEDQEVLLSLRHLRVGSCRWALLTEKGKHEEANELKQGIIRNLQIHKPAVLARKRQMERVSA